MPYEIKGIADIRLPIGVEKVDWKELCKVVAEFLTEQLSFRTSGNSIAEVVFHSPQATLITRERKQRKEDYYE